MHGFPNTIMTRQVSLEERSNRKYVDCQSFLKVHICGFVATDMGLTFVSSCTFHSFPFQVTYKILLAFGTKIVTILILEYIIMNE